MNNCQICNQPLKLIPAGVSRTTGKYYGQFWACNDRTHKQIPQAPQPVYQAPQPIYQPKQAYQAPQGQISGKNGFVAGGRDFYKENFGKCKHAFLVEVFKTIAIELRNNYSVMNDHERDAELWATMSMRKLSDKPLTPEQEGEINLNEPPY